jgi:hypothetical protein
MLHSPWIAALIALFLWWFSTGAILLRWAPGRGRARQARRAVMWNLPAGRLGVYGFATPCRCQ